jgi:rhodanese-related sulfurtransferase
MNKTLFRVAALAPALMMAVAALPLHSAEPSPVSPVPAPVLEPLPEAPPLTVSARKLLDTVNQRIHNIDTAGLLAQLKARPDTLVIDVRTPAELTLLGGRIDAPRFLNIARGWLEFQLEGYVTDKNAPIVVYCGVNQRSPLAADTLMKLGYTNVKNFSDGFFKWKQAGLPVQLNDKAPASFLYDLPQEVIPGVWSAIGATAPGTYDNSGHNNNLSFIITEGGVVVVNAGDNYLLAQSLHEEIKKRTSQPVKYVVLENGQGHALLGSGYWKEQGAKIVAHRDTAKYIERNGYEALAAMRARARDKAFKTEFTMPDIVYRGQARPVTGRMENPGTAPRKRPPSRRYHGLVAGEKTGHRRRHRLPRAHAADLRGHRYRQLDRGVGQVRGARR